MPEMSRCIVISSNPGNATRVFACIALLTANCMACIRTTLLWIASCYADMNRPAFIGCLVEHAASAFDGLAYKIPASLHASAPCFTLLPAVQIRISRRGIFMLLKCRFIPATAVHACC